MPPATPPTPPPLTPPVLPPPTPVPAPAPSWHRALFYGLAVMLIGLILGALAHWLFQPKPAPVVAKPPAVRKAAPAKKAVVKPAPSLPQTIINIYNGGCCLPSRPAVAPLVTPPPPPRASSPAPTVSSAPPAPPSGICSEADNYYCGTPPPAAPQSIPAASMEKPGRTVNVLSGNTFQLNILSGNGSYNGGARYGYSTYGWTPGHEELRYDPRTGTYYRVWVAHPQPGY